MTLHQVRAQVPDAQEAWVAMGHLIKDQIAALWVTESESSRQLSDWEVDVLLRSRLKDSGESVPNEDALTLRAAEKINEAYHREFGGWYYREYGGA